MHNGLKNVHSLLFGECLPGRCLATPEGWGRSRGQNWPTHVPGLELGAPGEHWETPEISENLAIPPSKCNQVHHASKLEVETFLFLVPFYQKMLVFPFKIPTLSTIFLFKTTNRKMLLSFCSILFQISATSGTTDETQT